MKKGETIKYIRTNFILGALAASTVIWLGEFISNYNNRNNIYRNNEIVINEEEQEKLEKIVSEATGKEVTIDDNSIILSAILNNDKLDEKEKDMFYKVTDLLEDNPYIDKENAYRNLQDIKVVYDPTADYGENIVGTYLIFQNKIVIISDNKNNTTLFHEIIHSIYTNSHRRENLPSFFSEGMTELLTDEYFEDKPFIEITSYSYEIIMVKLLCEIVGPDKVLETYSKGDMKILEDELTNKLGLSEPHELIKSMDNICRKIKKEEKDIDTDINNLMGVLYKYYESNYSVDSIEYEMYLYYQRLLAEIKERPISITYPEYLAINGYYVKPYFSKKLKDKYKEAFHAECGDNYSENNLIKIYKKNNDSLSI